MRAPLARARARELEVRLRAVQLERAGRRVLHDIDWVIAPGQRWVLVGGNGAGKTQLLKLVAGSVWPTPPTARRVLSRRRSPGSERLYLWRGERLSVPLEVRDEIAYLGPERQDQYERYGWNATVERIVGTGLYRTDIPLDDLTSLDRKQVGALLARLALSHLAGRRLLSLSYGERRLVLLARALATRPQLLLLDELLSGLDAPNRAHALRFLNSSYRGRLPWVLATHRLEDVPESATHALILERGRVRYRGRLAGAPLARWLGGTRAGREGTGKRRSGARAPRMLLRLTHAAVFLDGRRVLEDVSVTLRRGECWVVHGPNGSGKSTLLRTLYGEHGVAAGGRIERAGIAPGVPLERFQRRVGLVAPHLQSAHPRYLSVLEVVQSGRHASIGLARRSVAAHRLAALRALRLFGLASLAARPLRELSYGQLRRVLFARASLARPLLWLLDEPFAGLDAPTRGSLARHVDQLAQAGSCVVIATHHREEWPASSTHELELAGGRMLYAGPVRGARIAGVRKPARATSLTRVATPAAVPDA